ncbi:MAG: diaminobutyrate--2-oxoglutarate transaminase [Bacteroidota bacterium]
MISKESNVNGYARSFPTVFEKACKDTLTNTEGKTYIDFFSGAGALNYGHNNPFIKQDLAQFFDYNAPVHCLDMDSVVKLNFLDRFEKYILQPRNLDYKIQFPSPSGTNAVEAAIKLARKVTKRSKVIAFTNSFHGMTATSLAVSGSQEHRHSDIPNQEIIFFPHEGFMGPDFDSLAFLSKMMETKGSGVNAPAAIILETIQAEGGVNVASVEWLQRLSAICKKHGIVLIVDDIQVGCGRTGDFFSFEKANIYPDIVLLSKSISGYGLPLSIILLKPELDIWTAGEHNGTFRANNLSLAAATSALEHYWKDDALQSQVKALESIIVDKLEFLQHNSSKVLKISGRGLIWGITLENGELASNASKTAFEKGLIIETCGNHGQVLKILPPLVIEPSNLIQGIDILTGILTEVVRTH